MNLDYDFIINNWHKIDVTNIDPIERKKISSWSSDNLFGAILMDGDTWYFEYDTDVMIIKFKWNIQ